MNKTKCGDCSFYEPIGGRLAVCTFGIARRPTDPGRVVKDCKDAKPFKGIRYEYVEKL
jgi:hypothetical protein